MTHPAEDRMPPEPDPGWLEVRIPAVLAAVLATGLLIAGWKVLRHLVG